MEKVKLNVFLISKGIKDRTAIQAFLAENIEGGKIYFKGFCESYYDDSKRFNKNYIKEYMTLHKIAEIDSKITIKAMNIYITDTTTLFYQRTETTTLQKKLFEEKIKNERIIQLTIPREEKIKKLFEGRIINAE